MTSTAATPDRVSTTEIAALLAWARSLSQARDADLADRTAYLAAKDALLARIADQHADAASTKDTQ